MYTGKYPRWFTDNALGLCPRALSETTSHIFPVYTGYLGYNLYMYAQELVRAKDLKERQTRLCFLTIIIIHILTGV